jgi:nucleotide-binding universal stress UspA family protein
LLFLQVNLAVMTLRHKMPHLDRGFRIPWHPLVPVVGLLTNAFLAIYLFNYSPTAWYFGIGWIVVGLLAYYAYFSRIEAMEKPSEFLMEEVLVSRDYSVLVPVVDEEQARILGTIGAILAADNGGEVQALHVVRVPFQLTLGEGRLFLKEGRAYLESVIRQAKQRDVPVHTTIRLGRNVPEAVYKTAVENASDLILLGWPGYTRSSGHIYGSVIDALIDNPPSDVAMVRYRERRPVRAILVPVTTGPNSRRVVKLAVSMARAEVDSPARITLLHVLPERARTADRVRGEQAFQYVLEGAGYEVIEKRMVEGANVADTILQEAAGYDLIVMGATEESLFRNVLIGNTAEQVARRAEVTTIIVKRRSSRLHSMLRQTVLEPSVSRRAGEM